MLLCSATWQVWHVPRAHRPGPLFVACGASRLVGFVLATQAKASSAALPASPTMLRLRQRLGLAPPHQTLQPEPRPGHHLSHWRRPLATTVPHDHITSRTRAPRLPCITPSTAPRTGLRIVQSLCLQCYAAFLGVLACAPWITCSCLQYHVVCLGVPPCSHQSSSFFRPRISPSSCQL